VHNQLIMPLGFFMRKKIQDDFEAVKKAAKSLLQSEASSVNKVLADLSQGLIAQKTLILEQNAKDLAKMDPQDPKYDRLQLTEARIKDIADSLKVVIELPSPLHHALEERTLTNGLRLRKMTVPFGVIGVIYEARPNVTVDVFALCFKAGSACILKGGSEAHSSNLALIKVIHDALGKNSLPTDLAFLMPPEREATGALLTANGIVDLIIPRGGQGLIKWVRENSKVPVIETGAGIVHTFFDESGDLEKARAIILNAKTRRVAVCNALDTLIVHEKRLTDLPKLLAPLAEKQVEIFADQAALTALKNKYPAELLHPATPDHFGTEFLDYKMSIKTVRSLEEALAHIEKHSSRHSEAIISENVPNIAKFLNVVDAACVYANASTAFTDGGQFGMGAEIGISTQKLHARGPMALRELTSYKWVVEGSGQVRDGGPAAKQGGEAGAGASCTV
jgi:glutamate-5-semialdehyde dehydrogenase